MARTLFSWIHLSDIHFGHGAPSDRYDQKMVLRRLRRDLDDARKEGAPEKLDAIFVTGDIAFSGGGRDPNEYVEAQTWLLEVAAQVGLSAKDVFVVPGNHDVDRGKDRLPMQMLLMPQLRKGDMEMDTALNTPELKGALEERMRRYLDFASGFAPACREAGRKGELFWVEHLTANDLKVRIAGLDTSILCAADDDSGKLRIGTLQILKGLYDPPAKGELVIVLTHHPLRPWLEDADARYAEQKIESNAHLHLCGHVHEAKSSMVRTGGGRGGVRVVAGATHNERQPASWVPAGHGYNWGAVVADGASRLKLRIWPRRWSDGNDDFRVDVDNTERGKPYAEHELSVEVPASETSGVAGPTAEATSPGAVTQPAKTAAAPTAPEVKPVAPAAPKPIEVFYFYAPEDEGLLKALDTHLALLKKGKVIASFSKREIGAGTKADEALRERIEAAGVFLALLSPSFIASDDFDGPEIGRMLERAEEGSALFVPIFLKPFDLSDNPIWESSRMQRFQGLPRPEKSDAVKWAAGPGRDLDTELSGIATELRKTIKAHFKL